MLFLKTAVMNSSASYSKGLVLLNYKLYFKSKESYHSGWKNSRISIYQNFPKRVLWDRSSLECYWVLLKKASVVRLIWKTLPSLKWHPWCASSLPQDIWFRTFEVLICTNFLRGHVFQTAFTLEPCTWKSIIGTCVLWNSLWEILRFYDSGGMQLTRSKV